MKRIIEWLKTNRWQHLVGGLCVGFGANSWYCAGYAGLVYAGSWEYKEKMRGYKWNWGNFALTAAGVIVGHIVRVVP